jgi:DNA repair and recombination protein RAD52
MTFSPEQKGMLAAPLSRDVVKTRRQGNLNVSYVTAWHAIAEANRIFGFDGWTRETVDVHCVAEIDRKIGVTETFEGYDGFGVTYTCRVRVTVGDVVREGCGAGHGIDRDVGQAHESAIKEAESDAMKRALMTFGNPFGLALYDKSQANVADEPPPENPALVAARETYITGCQETIISFTDKAKLSAWWKSDAQKAAREKYQLSPGEFELLKARVVAKGEALGGE